MAERIKEAKCIKTFSGDEVVGITTFKGKLIIATKSAVYIYPKEKKRGKNV